MGKIEKDVYGPESKLQVPGLAMKIATDMVAKKLNAAELLHICRRIPDIEENRQGYPVGLANMDMLKFGAVTLWLVNVPVRNRAILPVKRGSREVVSLNGLILSKENMKLRSVVNRFMKEGKGTDLEILVEFQSRLVTIQQGILPTQPLGVDTVKPSDGEYAWVRLCCYYYFSNHPGLLKLFANFH